MFYISPKEIGNDMLVDIIDELYDMYYIREFNGLETTGVENYLDKFCEEYINRAKSKADGLFVFRDDKEEEAKDMIAGIRNLTRMKMEQDWENFRHDKVVTTKDMARKLLKQNVDNS